MIRDRHPSREENAGEKHTHSILCTSTHIVILSFPLTTGGKCVRGEMASRHKNTFLHTHCEILCCHIVVRTFMLYTVKSTKYVAHICI